MNSVDWESFTAGLSWGIALVVGLICLDIWTTRRPAPPPPPDPFDTLRWEVHAAARKVIDDAAR